MEVNGFNPSFTLFRWMDVRKERDLRQELALSLALSPRLGRSRALIGATLIRKPIRCCRLRPCSSGALCIQGAHLGLTASCPIADD